jgi:hypothetical protein
MSESCSDRYQLECFVWDLFKDLHGIRPRHLRFSEMSDSELLLYADSLIAEYRNAQESARLEQLRIEAEERADAAIQAQRSFGEPLESALSAALRRIS